MNALEQLTHLTAAEKEKLGAVYTPKEIAQQPATWQQTWALLKARLPEIQAFLSTAGVRGPAAERPTVFLVGAGTSDYIGRSLHHLLRREWQSEVVAVSSTDLLTDFADYLIEGQKYLWISFSRSGDSPEGVAVLERALAEQPQIAHIVVSCNADGKMSRLIKDRANALSLILGKETNDESLAMTSSFTNMVLTGQVLAHAWTPEAYEPVHTALCAAAEAFLPVAADLAAELAQKRYPRVCLIGSALLAGAATESALKVLELTAGGIKTMTQATLALRHGPMAALDNETLFIALLSTEKARQRYEVDLIREIERKGLVAKAVAVLGSGAAAPPQFESTQLLQPAGAWEIPDLYRPPLDTIFGQLLGLFSSLAHGLSPDAPSPNGAITRVVQPIQIY
ncbi:SIS domain-containing protein [Silvibacterium sp.]|uniref:SIS domain-containing protein n=1 Tax=Silvibacterium sp. TaxID=1964179 RepID=UPI0039E36DAA